MRRLRFLLGCLAIVLGLVFEWLGRAIPHDIDGISYLDMGEAYLRADWKTALNALWSPLYALLISGAVKIVKPSPSWEAPVVHLVGFAIYVAALLSFEFLWIEFRQVLREKSGSQPNFRITFPDWAWLLLGYSLFLWVSLRLISLTSETPDMLLAAAVYLASALLLRISADRARTPTFILLGLILGVGYLTKAVLFPLSFVFLAVATWTTYRRKRSLAPPLLAVLMFLLTSSPLLALLSKTKGRPTFGDSGRINYLWHVDRIPRMYWQGNYPGSGAPIHPPRLIVTKPPVYEFASPFAATFSPWYDPSYWYDGMKPHFNLRKQLRALIEAAGIYHGLFFKPGATLLAMSVILLLLDGSVKHLADRLDVLLPAIAALGLYAFVHVEPRYVAPFILVFWGAVLCQVRLRNTPFASRLLRLSIWAIVIVYSGQLLVGALGIAATEKGLAQITQEQLQVATSMGQAGLQPGDRVATIAGMSSMIWARLAKLRIVADLPDSTNAWFEHPDSRSRVLTAFSATGAKAIVAFRVPPSWSTDGWIRIGETEYYLYPLAPTGTLPLTDGRP